MSATEERLKKVIKDNFDLDHEPDFNAQFSDLGITSVQVIAFYKVVNEEFNLGMAANDCQQFKTLQELVVHIDSRA